MLRKLIAFAITSGLAKKAWDHYRSSRAPAAAARRRSHVAARTTPAARARATTVKPKA